MLDLQTNFLFINLSLGNNNLTFFHSFILSVQIFCRMLRVSSKELLKVKFGQDSLRNPSCNVIIFVKLMHSRKKASS